MKKQLQNSGLHGGCIKNLLTRGLLLFVNNPILLALAFLLSLTSIAHAATRIWTGGGADNNWSTLLNWNIGTLPVAGDILQFDGTTQLTSNNDIAAGTSFASITFNAGAGAFTITGNNIILAGNITNNSANLQTININMAWAAGAHTVATTSGSIAISAIISGAGGLILSGPNTLTLTGVNSYTGSTTISAGTLNANATAAIGNGSATNTLIFTGGTLQAAGTITSPATRTVTLTNTAIIDNNGQTISIAGIMSGAGGVTKNGSGTLTLSGVNTYTGATTVNAGTLAAGVLTSSFGNGSNVTLANTAGAAIDITGFNTTIGSITGGGGTGGNITLGAATLTVGNGTSPAAYAGVISGSGSLIKTGTGTITLSGLNTYTGTTSIQNGTLSINTIQNVSGGASAVGAPTTIANGTIALGNGATSVTLVYTGTGATTDRVLNLIGTTGGAVIDQSGSGTLTFSSALTATGAGSKTLTLQGSTGSGGVLQGAIVNNSGANKTSVVKTGSGTWTLSGVSTYTGTTTVNGGVLAAGVATQAFGLTSAVTLANTAGVILDITGYDNTIGSLTGGGGTGGNVTLGSATLTVGSDNSSPAAYAGIISGSGNLIKTGTGTVTLSGLSTYTGTTSVQNGTVSINTIQNVSGGASAVGAPTTAANGTIALGSAANTGVLIYTGTGSTTDRVLDLAGTTGGGTITQSGSGLLTFTSDFTATGAGSKKLTLQGSTASGGVLQGAIVNNSGANKTSVVKTGSGAWTLSGVSTYTGTTTVNGGVLAAGVATQAFGLTSAVTLANTAGVILDITGYDNTIGSLTGGGGTGGNVTLGSATLTVGSDNSSPAAYAGIISGSGNLIKTGTGTVTLSGLSTYTGTTSVQNGTASINTIQNVSGGASAVGAPTTAANGTIALGSAANAGVLIYTGTGSTTDRVLDLAGTTGGGTITQSGSGLLTFTSDFTATGAGLKTLTLQGSTASGGALQGAIVNNSGANRTSVTKAGTSIWTLSGLSTYSGSTTISTGTLNANATDALGDGSATNTLIFTGGTLQAGGTITSPATRTVTLTNTAIIDNNGQAISIAGIISGGQGVTKNGNGTLTLSGVNTYTGATTVNAGTLAAGVLTSSFGNGSNVTLANTAGAALDITGFNTTVGSITGGGGTGGNITLGAATLTVGNATSPAAYAGAISGTGSLIKAGGGTIILSGTNTYSGTTTINVGTLTINGSNNGAGAITVAAGATLAGTGTIAGTVDASAAGAKMAPGNGGGGTLTLGLSGGSPLTLGAGSILNFDIGTTSDQVALSGASSNLTLAGTLNITQGAGFAAGTYTIFTYTGTVANNGLQIGAAPSGFSYQFNTATAGQVKLIIAPAGSPVQIYYSVGRTATDLKNAANISITAGTAVFTSAQPNNIGVGDKIVYDATNKTAFISGRTSSTQYSVITSTGGTPGDVSNVSLNSITRAFNHLNTAVNTTQTSAGSANFLNTTNLVTGNYVLNIPCYGDSVDTCQSTVGTWTTDAAHFIKIYTPLNTNEVGISQRHLGTWDKTKYYTMTQPGATYVLGIKTNFCKVYGLQFDLKAVAGADAVLVDCSVVGTVGVIEIAYNLITTSVPASSVGGISVYIGSNSPTVKIYNNVIWGLTGGGNTCAMFLGWAGLAPTCYVYNNTSYNNLQGIMANTGTIVAKNNLIYQSVTAANNYVGTFSASGTNNLSGPPVSAAMPGTNARNGVQVVFEDPSNSDFRLSSADTGARKMGANLFTDPNLSFSDDLTGETRPGTWDIGARQWNDATSTQVPTLALPATNGSSNASVGIDFTLPEAALAGTVKMTFTRTGGTADAQAPHVITFNNSGGFENAGRHTATLSGAAMATNANVGSITPASPNDKLVNGTIYSVRLEYQDAAGNPVAAVVNTNFTYSITAATLSSPASNSYSNASLYVDFTLPQAAQAGSVKLTFARTGGTADGQAPHVVTFNNANGFEASGQHTTTLNGAALAGNANVASATPASPNDQLVDGSVYSVSLDYKNTVGTQMPTSTNANFTYSVSAPTWAGTYPKTGTITGSTAQFLAKTDKNGKAYFVVLQSGATAPTSAQVKAGQDASGNPVATGFSGFIAMIANYESDFTASNLVSGTTYDAYLVAEDVVPNLQGSPSKVSFTCNDVTPPIWAGTYPKTGTIAGTTAQMLVKTNENGNAYFVVLASGAAAPSSAQVKAGQDATGTPVASGKSGNISISANTEGNFSASSLTPSTTFDSYLVAEDAVPNLQASPVKVTFSTVGDVTPPTWAQNYPKIGTISGTTAQFLVQTDENGTAYFVVVAHGDPAPVSAEVKNGQKSGGGVPVASGNTALTANTQANFSALGLVSGTSYDAYFVAQDIIPNLQASPAMLTFTARTQPTVNWGRNDLTAVRGAATGDTKIYVGAGNTLYALALSNGATSWSYTSGHGACGMPSYAYIPSSSTYRIIFCQGTYLVRYDDPGGYQWSVDLGASPGTPYASTDDNSVYVPLGNNKLTKRSMATGARDGTFGAGSDITLSNASILCDINVYSGYLMAGSTGGVVTLFDASTGAVLSSYTTGSGVSINQPLVSQGNILYVAPATNTLYARSASNLNTPAWSSGLTLGGTTTGAPYADVSDVPTKIYIAVGSSIQRITDNGTSGSVDAGFTYNAGATVQSGPIPFNGYVYFGRNSGQYHCYNGSTMADAVNWPFQNASGNATTGPWIDIISSPNQVLFGTDAGDMDAFNTQ